MNILIYEDCAEDTIALKDCINKFFWQKNYDYRIWSCTDSKNLFDNLNKVDLIFLDIELADENGIDIGLAIRKINSNVRIIITSNYKKYLIDGYKIHADRYFTKPIEQNFFNIEFENVVNDFFIDASGFFDKKISNDIIYPKDILYIEFIGRKSCIHFANFKKIETPYTLKYWEEKLDTVVFGKSHRSFLLNFKYISAFSKNEVILINSEQIPLSRKYKKSFNEAYLENLHRFN